MHRVAPSYHVPSSGTRQIWGKKMTTRHVPVMTAEVLRYLVHANARTVVDATVGAGGHADAILSAHESLTLIGIDRDPAALALAATRLARFGRRYTGVQAPFAELARVL